MLGTKNPNGGRLSPPTRQSSSGRAVPKVQEAQVGTALSIKRLFYLKDDKNTVEGRSNGMSVQCKSTFKLFSKTKHQ